MPPNWRDSRKKLNIQSNIRTLLGRNCEVEKIMKFLKENQINSWQICMILAAAFSHEWLWSWVNSPIIKTHWKILPGPYVIRMKTKSIFMTETATTRLLLYYLEDKKLQMEIYNWQLNINSMNANNRRISEYSVISKVI